MNLVASAPWWLVGVFCALLLAAAVQDSVQLRISNLTSTAVLVAGLVAIAFVGLELRLWQNGLVFLAVLVFGTLMFSLGKFGGGDVKLLAASALWFDLKTAGLMLVPAIFIAGGLLAALVLIARRIRRQRDGTGTKKVRGVRLPYGVAIAAGAAFTTYSVLDKAANPLRDIPLLPQGAAQAGS